MLGEGVSMHVMRKRQEGRIQERRTAPGASPSLMREEREGRGGWCWGRDQSPQFPPPGPHPLPSSLFRPERQAETNQYRMLINELMSVSAKAKGL
jgi:hypothetical protein